MAKRGRSWRNAGAAAAKWRRSAGRAGPNDPRGDAGSYLEEEGKKPGPLGPLGPTHHHHHRATGRGERVHPPVGLLRTVSQKKIWTPRGPLPPSPPTTTTSEGRGREGGQGVPTGPASRGLEGKAGLADPLIPPLPQQAPVPRGFRTTLNHRGFFGTPSALHPAASLAGGWVSLPAPS